MAENPLTYSISGVNYDMMDPFKIVCQKAAITTAGNIERFNELGLGIHEITASRGESAYEIEFTHLHRVPRFRIAHVEEGLGTKNEVADQMRQLQDKLTMAEEARKILGKSFYRGIAIDNAAMILNDLSTRGASPLSFMLHVAAYPADWFTDEERNNDLIEGTVDACNQARCTWGGGESPALRDIINPGHALLSGSAIGLSFPSHNSFFFYEYHWQEPFEQEGLRIILLGSSGPHANGITLLRKDLVERLPKGYEFELYDGQTYGEAVLAPTVIYSRLIDEVLSSGLHLAYAIHISGHGWRKLMRAQRELTYVIDKIPEPQPIFKLVQQVSGMTNGQMYGDYNMGAGFALFVAGRDTQAVVQKATDLGYSALDAGYIEKGPRKVIINPLGVVFEGSTLQIR